MLTAQFEREVERKTKYIGRGRGGANRKQEVVEKIRYQITAVKRDDQKIEEVKKRFGWKAYVTSTSKERLSLEDGVRLYRQECRIERIFHRLKDRLNICYDVCAGTGANQRFKPFTDVRCTCCDLDRVCYEAIIGAGTKHFTRTASRKSAKDYCQTDQRTLTESL